MDVAGNLALLHLAPHDLREAVEDYDLALARLAWASDCCCQIQGDQAEAVAWHRNQCDETLAAIEAMRCPSYPPADELQP